MLSARSEDRAGCVLLVDDNDALRSAIAAELEEFYRVVTAANGVEALERVLVLRPDVIVSDINMPGMDGLELLGKLRESPSTSDIPVILLSALTDTDHIVRGFKTGADDYLTKPFSMPELRARINSKMLRRPAPLFALKHDAQTGLLSKQAFNELLQRELVRIRTGGSVGCLAVFETAELGMVRERLGEVAEAEVIQQLGRLLASDSRGLDRVGRVGPNRFAILLVHAGPRGAAERLRRLHQQFAIHPFTAAGQRVHLTPVSGFVELEPGDTIELLYEQAEDALARAALHLDLEPVRHRGSHVRKLGERLFAACPPKWRSPLQVTLVHAAGLGIPFMFYVAMATLGIKIVAVAYYMVAAALLGTALSIWIEAIAAMRETKVPPVDGPAPPASAIVAAYLPNEAATIVETIEAFLRVDYPGELQIILAYNSPHFHPVEWTLRKMAETHPRFLPLRVPFSTSKAQNVNAALAEATGEFIGIFDADHHPAPDAFSRARAWLQNGYDVVQGHCLVRNGDESRVAKTIAVEFEVIYASSHPGRARVQGYGIFGGSNGYWRAEVLRRTRLHGTMLTEDIDSSLRVLSEGGHIKSDPDLISRELAPTSLKALWHQRMRWAQGWFQVSRKHLWPSIRAKNLTVRQKVGLAYLLWWREVYPWISIQMWPILGYHIWSRGTARDINWFIPIYLATTVFTIGTGPAQVLLAMHVADKEIKQRRWWVVRYLFWSPFYSEFKNVIARVAQFKEFAGERKWVVTPRKAKAD